MMLIFAWVLIVAGIVEYYREEDDKFWWSAGDTSLSKGILRYWYFSVIYTSFNVENATRHVSPSHWLIES